MESSKATAKHIRHVAGDLPAAQVQLMRHQPHPTSHWELPQKKTELNIWPETAKPQKFPHPRNHLICRDRRPTPISATSAVIHYMQKAFYVQPENSNARYATSLVTPQQCVTKKVKVNTHQVHFNQGNQKHNNFMQGPYTPYHDANSSEYESEIEDTFCLQMKIHRTCISHPKVPKPVYLMANLAYCLQEHH